MVKFEVGGGYIVWVFLILVNGFFVFVVFWCGRFFNVWEVLVCFFLGLCFLVFLLCSLCCIGICLDLW